MRLGWQRGRAELRVERGLNNQAALPNPQEFLHLFGVSNRTGTPNRVLVKQMPNYDMIPSDDLDWRRISNGREDD